MEDKSDRVRLIERDPTKQATAYIVIPVYNRLQYTLACLRCLRAQTYQRLHLIVVDGGSTDGTLEVLKNEHSDVTLLQGKGELWWGGAMRLGVEHVLSHSRHDHDMILMMNKDTEVEPLEITAAREVREETGIDVSQHPLSNWGKQNQFEIFERWRYRYAPGVTHNTEHVFSLLVPAPLTIQLAAAEHLQYQWLPWQAAAEKCFSWSNVDAIRELPARMAANSA